MAKRKRRTRPLGHITNKEVDALEDRMDRMGSEEYRLKAERKTVEARWIENQIQGALKAADAIGMPCSCFFVTKKLRQCACGRTDTAMVNRKKSKQAAYRRFKREAR